MQGVRNAHLVYHLSHHGLSRAGMGLVSGHCRGGIVQHHQRHVRLVVHSVHHAGDRRGEERGISHKGKTSGVRFDLADALGHVDTSAHAKTSIHHIQRHGIAQCIAADIAKHGTFIL